MSDVIDVEVTQIEETPVEAVEVAPSDQIVITITESSASYQSSLPPHEIVFWLELMKGMIVKSLLDGTPADSEVA